jgi:hypothetical protein
MIERERSGGGEREIISWEIHIYREREVTGEREWDRDGGREREREVGGRGREKGRKEGGRERERGGWEREVWAREREE